MRATTTEKTYADGTFKCYLTQIDTKPVIFAQWGKSDFDITFETYDGTSDENDYAFTVGGGTVATVETRALAAYAESTKRVERTNTKIVAGEYDY
jgi:hypothetical protein